MIEYLNGRLLERRLGHVVIDVGGVGYALAMPPGAAARLGELGAEATVWVRTQVREDAIRLFGFATPQQREAFDVFLTMAGVGPAIGLAILSEMTLADIVQAALTGDAARFRAIKGIGPKLAEKLVFELKGKAELLAAGLPPEARAEAVAGEPALAEIRGPAARDAVAALETLDVKPAQAHRAIALALEELGEDATVEQLVREGLKHRR